MSAIAIIPARGGSRRIPWKNIRLFAGIPILAYPIETAKESGLFDEIYVSTEDEHIANIAETHHAKVISREPNLAHDYIGTQEVIHNALKVLPEMPDYVCCIYPCTPLMTSEMLITAHKMLEQNVGCNYVVPVGEWLVDPGQFYFGRYSAFRIGEPLLSEMTMMMPIDKRRARDINTEEDWKAAEKMYDIIGRVL